MTLDELEGSLCTLFQNTCAMVLLFIYFQFHIQSAFSRQMTAGIIKVFNVLKLKQTTIKHSLGVGKTCCIARFPCNSTALLLVFTARCTLVQSAVLRSHVVCLSVTLVDCDHIGWNSSKIISSLVSLGCSLFATPT